MLNKETINILIAEDDPLSRRLLVANLADWGHQPIVCENGQQALKYFQTENLEQIPQIAILDIMMPEMDGMELVRRVRECQTAAPPYLIILTAKKSKEEIVAGIEAGANDYICKPFHRSELRVRLDVGIKTVNLQSALATRVHELSEALAHVKLLQGFLAICSYCKNIRTDQNQWEGIEAYISEHSEARFSHSICPECYEIEVKPMLENMEHNHL